MICMYGSEKGGGGGCRMTSALREGACKVQGARFGEILLYCTTIAQSGRS